MENREHFFSLAARAMRFVLVDAARRHGSDKRGGNAPRVALEDAGEIVSPVPLARVPLTLPWYLGLANVRGLLVGVIDLARYLGEDLVWLPDGRSGEQAAASTPRATGGSAAAIDGRAFNTARPARAGAAGSGIRCLPGEDPAVGRRARNHDRQL